MIVKAQSLDGVRPNIRRRAIITFRLEELLDRRGTNSEHIIGFEEILAMAFD